MAELPAYTITSGSDFVVMEVGEETARPIKPVVVLSSTGHMVLRFGSGNFFMSPEGALHVADMLAEAAMLGSNVITSEETNGIPH